MAKHAICHVEWDSTDFERTKRFYGGLFEWNFQPWGDEYLLFSVPGGIGGGFCKKPQVTPNPMPRIYVQVDAIEPYLQRASELGGGIAEPKTEIPQVGWWAFLTDPDGNMVGLFQGAPQ